MAVAYAAWLLPTGLVLIPLANRFSSRPEAAGATRRPFVRPLDGAGVVLLVVGWCTVGLVAMLLVTVLVGSFLTAVGVDARPTLSPSRTSSRAARPGPWPPRCSPRCWLSCS